MAARTRDRHLIDDLTQETLARLADREHRLSPDAQRAYAVVTARNLLSSHYRGQSVRGRHLHRLVDRDGADDPAQVTIDKEETDALTSALGQLDPVERDLLMRHEVTGTDLATLAGEDNVSRGAIAMRLARARANLRLEFLLAFRRVELPTERCRPVLLALAVGDARRQAQLDADDHVDQCPVCATLVAPLTERNRRIAGWLLIPLAEGLRRAWRTTRRYPAQAASAILIAAAASGIALAQRSPDTPERPTAAIAAPSSSLAADPSTTTTDLSTIDATAATSAPSTTVAAPVPVASAIEPAPPPTAPPAPVASAPPAPGTAATSASPCPPPAPLDEIDLTAALGCPFGVTVVTITEVSSGGLSATTAASRPVAIELVGAQAVPMALAPGVRVSVVGVVSSGPGESLAVEVNAGDLRLAG